MNFVLGFAPATRLPIYLCLQCLANTLSVHSDSKIQPFEFDRDCDALEEGDSPFLTGDGTQASAAQLSPPISIDD